MGWSRCFYLRKHWKAVISSAKSFWSPQAKPAASSPRRLVSSFWRLYLFLQVFLTVVASLKAEMGFFIVCLLFLPLGWFTPTHSSDFILKTTSSKKPSLATPTIHIENFSVQWSLVCLSRSPRSPPKGSHTSASRTRLGELVRCRFPGSNLREWFQRLEWGLRICLVTTHTVILVWGSSEESCNKQIACLRAGDRHLREPPRASLSLAHKRCSYMMVEWTLERIIPSPDTATWVWPWKQPHEGHRFILCWNGGGKVLRLVSTGLNWELRMLLLDLQHEQLIYSLSLSVFICRIEMVIIIITLASQSFGEMKWGKVLSTVPGPEVVSKNFWILLLWVLLSLQLFF